MTPPTHAQVLGDDKQSVLVRQILAQQPRELAYTQFIDIFLISPSHESELIRKFIDRARNGDGNAFAQVAFMIWQGDSGFRVGKAAAELALSKAILDGAGAGAFFMGETYLQAPADTDAARADLFKTALYWFGMASGMGVPPAHDRARVVMQEIESMIKVDRNDLVKLFNNGLAVGKPAQKISS